MQTDSAHKKYSFVVKVSPVKGDPDYRSLEICREASNNPFGFRIS